MRDIGILLDQGRVKLVGGPGPDLFFWWGAPFSLNSNPCPKLSTSDKTGVLRDTEEFKLHVYSRLIDTVFIRSHQDRHDQQNPMFK